MAAKKAAAKRTKKAKASEVFYVLSGRKKLFQWEPVKLYPTYELAKYYKDLFEGVSIYGYAGYKITTVILVTEKPDANEIVSIP